MGQSQTVVAPQAVLDGTDGPTLPADLTSFVGRRAELHELKRQLSTFRLVTLTGFGGVGKTRLALQAARDLRRQFHDGVAWVELADLRDPALLAQTVEDSLHIPDKVGSDPLGILLNHLRDRKMVLVLDNGEHLLDACAVLIDELLRSAPGLRILVTSRQAMGVPGECLLPVAPLLVPTELQAGEPGAAVQYPALALFAERASTSAPGFEITAENQRAVAEVCRKLEGIPLAIELATVKLRILSVDELATRLDARLKMLSQTGRTGPTRHQTIQATIDWSHELCTAAEKLLWARASVFAGGFSVEAAEACCSDADLPVDDVLDALAGLVDKSILMRTEIDGCVRFRLLEPLREYGESELIRAGEEARAHDRHLDWCAEFVNQACLQWFGPAQERWCVTLRLEKSNVRAAAEYCLQQPGREETALRLLGEPWFLWVALFLDEGRHWLEKALKTARTPTPARARALATAGYVAALQGDAAAAEGFVMEGRALASELGDSSTLAYGTHMLGLMALFTDAPDRAVVLLSEAVPAYDADPDVLDDYPVAARVQLGLALMFQGDIEGATEQFDTCRRLCSVTGERWLLSYALYGLAFVSKLEGDLAGGVALAREALVIKRFFQDTLGQAVCLDLLGWVRAETGQFKEAAVLMGSASRLWDSFGVRLFGSEHWLAQGELAVERCTAALGTQGYAASFEKGNTLPRDEALAFALGERAKAEKAVDLGEVSLTSREREIAGLVAEGLSNKAISDRLVIAQRTAESHVEHILTKFGFHSRSQIAAWVGKNRPPSE